MTKTSFSRALTVALLGLALTAAARADTKDYEFQLVKDEAKQGEAILDVRLVEVDLGDRGGDLGEGQDSDLLPLEEQALHLFEFLQLHY